jgi:eukaryotic translation initiation factor 2C
VNVDVSNQTFWVGQKFEQLARNYISGADKKFANSTSHIPFYSILPLSFVNCVVLTRLQ